MEYEEEQQMQQSDHSNIASEDPSYHAIKVYNMLEDSLWERLDLLENATNINDVIHVAKEVRVLLLRGDKVWSEIKNSIAIKAEQLKIKDTSFKYDGELNTYASYILNIIKISVNAQFFAFNGSLEEQIRAKNYLELSPIERLSFIVSEVEKTILEATELWGEKAAEINFTMPINIKDTRDPFL
jgi:hypothetical protein